MSARDLVFDRDKLDPAPPPAAGRRAPGFDVGAKESPAPPPAARRPAFFDIGDDPPPRARLFDAAPAPFDPHVPALPPRLAAGALAQGNGAHSGDSGLLDLRALVGRDVPKKKATEDRVAADLFNLSGGLFADAAPVAPLVAPDLRALRAPVAPDSARRGAASPPPGVGAPPRANVAVARGAGPVPVVSERSLLGAGVLPVRGRAAWVAAIALLGGGLLFLSFKLGTRHAAASARAVETSGLAPVPLETARPARPAVTAPLPATATVTATPLAPAIATVTTPALPVSASREREPSAPAIPRSNTTTALPTPPPATPAAATARVAAPPTVTAPPPSGNAEFDRSAAVSALSAAAGRAAGCKQADDPTGSAHVSLTFAPSGRVTSSKVTNPPFQGTATGGCIASAFRSASVPPFDGVPVSVSRDVTIR